MQQLKRLKDKAHLFAPQFRLSGIVQPAVETPSMSTIPLVGKSIAPARFSSVDFPQPLRPTNATNSPAWTSSVTSRKSLNRLTVGQDNFC